MEIDMITSATGSGYVPPAVTVHGSVADLTRANAVGTVTDHSFPAGTPIMNLTFSGT